MKALNSNIQKMKDQELKSVDGGIWPLLLAAVVYDGSARLYEMYTGEDVPTLDDLF